MDKQLPYMTTLYSKATVLYNNQFVTGLVTMISEKGINVKTRTGTTFYRWHQVVHVVPGQSKGQGK